jgi:hypothetical protein
MGSSPSSLPGSLAGAQHNLVTDVRGAARLLVEATAGVTGLVEAMHGTIAGLGGRLPGASNESTRGITGLVYRCIGGVTQLVGSSLDLALHPLAGLTALRASAPGRETAVAILNGVLGDHLEMTGNPLAITMGLRRHGAPLVLETAAIRAAIPRPTRKILIQAHGLCMSDLHWARDGHDQYAALGDTLGYTALHLHYNTGRSIAANGRALAMLLESLLEQWPMPVEEIAIVAHSMGGLIARSAYHHAAVSGHAWPARLGKLVFLGTPHHGSPLERAGNRLDQVLGLSPYTLPFTRLGRVRSAGITDLRHGSLLDEDWGDADRYAGVPPAQRTPVPLPRGVACFAVAAVRAQRDDTNVARLVGDGLVPVASALGEHADPRYALDFPETARWIGRGMGHLALLSHPQVYAQVGRWLDS